MRIPISIFFAILLSAMAVAQSSSGGGTNGSGTVTNTLGGLTLGLPVIGNNSADIAVGTKTGNTTLFPTFTGAATASRCIDTDANGNLQITAADCGTGSLPSGTQGYPVINFNNSTGYSTSAIFVDATQFSGADMCAKIVAARASPSCSGASNYCYVRAPFIGKQLCTSSPFSGWTNAGALDFKGAAALDIRTDVTWAVPPSVKLIGAGVATPHQAFGASTSGTILRANNLSLYNTGGSGFSVPSVTGFTISAASGSPSLATVTTSSPNGTMCTGGSGNNGQDVFIYPVGSSGGLPAYYNIANHFIAVNIACGAGTVSTSFQIAVPSGTTACTANCGTIYEGTSLLRNGNPGGNAQYNSFITDMGVSCSWVVGCIPYLNDDAEEQSGVYRVSFFNTGGEFMRLSEFATAGSGDGLATGGGDSQSGWMTNIIGQYLAETCEVTSNSGCNGATSVGTGNSVYETYSNTGDTLTGTVNTQNSGIGGCSSNCVSWVSGSKFGSNWTGTVTITGATCSPCTITSVISPTLIQVSAPTGSNSGATYSRAVSTGVNFANLDPLNCNTLGILVDGPKIGGGTVTNSHIGEISNGTLLFGTPSQAGGVPVNMSTATCGTPYTSASTPIGIVWYGAQGSFHDFSFQFAPTEAEIGGNASLNAAFPGINVGATPALVKTDGVSFRTLNGCCNASTPSAMVDIGAGSQNINLESLNRIGGTVNTIKDNVTGITCADKNIAFYRIGSGPPPAVESSCGLGNTQLGSITLNGATSGSSILGVAAVAGTPNKINFPTVTGTARQMWSTDGNNPQQASWSYPAISDLTSALNSATIANGNNPLVLNWTLTTDATNALTCGETAAATNGTLTNALANQVVCNHTTLAGSTASPFGVLQGSVTGATGPPAAQFQTTWNNAALVGHLIFGNVTNTASAATADLLNLRVGNTPQVIIDKGGNGFFTGGLATGTATVPAAGVITFPAGGSLQSADTGTPTVLFGTNNVSFNKPITSPTYNTCPDSSGSGSAQVCNTTPTFTVVAGSCFTYTTTTANTGTGLTVNPNSLGAKSVSWQGSTTLAANYVKANQEVVLCYDGTNLELSKVDVAPAAGSGAPATVTKLAKTANYTTVTGDFSNATTPPTEVTYTISSSTSVTHTMLASAPALVSGNMPCEIIENSINSIPYPLLLNTNSLTLDGTAYTAQPIWPGQGVKICSDGSNYILADGSRIFPPDFSTGSIPALNGGASSSCFAVGTATANQIQIDNILHVGPNGAKVSNIRFFLNTNDPTGTNHYDMGLVYGAPGTNGVLMAHIGAQGLTQTTGTTISIALTATTYLPPGDYWFVVAGNNASATNVAKFSCLQTSSIYFPVTSLVSATAATAGDLGAVGATIAIPAAGIVNDGNNGNHAFFVY
jgi:hypothetical protein